jgi:predicted Zn-ribbon and HTH transcriptional regulator
MPRFKKIASQLRSGKTQSEIAGNFGLSRQRISQIAKEALPRVKSLKITCKRCGHHWKSRNGARPVKCAKCHSRYWDTAKPEPRNPFLYYCWKNMMARCNNPKHFAYRFCGGRGVKVCRRWKRFETFAADMGLRPKGTILLRIKPNGLFSPNNCIWGSRKDQARHRRPWGSVSRLRPPSRK